MSANSSSAVPTDLFYQKYHDTGFSFTLVWFRTPLFTIGTAGMVLNGSLLYMLWKCRSSLTSSFHYLLAMETLGSLIFDSFFPLMFFAVLLPGTNYIRAENCFFFAFLAIFGSSIQQTMMMFISVERLLCVQCPIWHHNFVDKQKRHIYWILTTSLSVAYASVKCIFLYIGLHGELAGKDVECRGKDFYAGWWKTISQNMNLGIEVATIVFYAWIWAIMVKGAITKVQVTNSYNMHILKALSVIMAIIIFGWMQYAVVQPFLPLMKLNPEDLSSIVEMLGTMAGFASITNGPILYMFSSEYRRNFQKVFPRIFGDGQTTAEQNSTRPVQEAWK